MSIYSAFDASVHVVVCAGGSGTRFWPLSREHRPKQLLSLMDSGSLLQNTFTRLAGVVDSSRWWMVVGQSHADACREHVPVIDAERCLVEPCARNTAAAIGLAALHILKKDPEAIMIVLPADHFVADIPAFLSALNAAIEVARTDKIVTLGIEPTHAETGYGYIEKGAASGLSQSYQVERFCEKPPRAQAEAFLSSGRYLWNAGIFVMRAQRLEQDLNTYAAETAKPLWVLSDFIGKSSYGDKLKSIYESIPSISIDYAVMEHSKNLAVIACSCGWSDVGSFDALSSIWDKDLEENICRGRVLSLASKRCIVYSSGDHVTALLGMEDVIVVNTKDATLICHKQCAQDVKQITAALRKQGWEDVC
jgi:mannose-1-phosphate guanylyltransferase